MKYIDGGICAPKGFKASGIHCGIRKNRTKRDLALILSEKMCSAAAVYTTNKVKGAPLTVTKNNISDGHAIAAICNSGNANTCMADGVEKAELMCNALGKQLNIAPTDIVVASTGVIGQPLNTDAICAGIPALCDGLSADGCDNAAEAIMTTDTIKKAIAVEFELNGKPVRIGAIAKGSGMINPNMATMLCFVTTDVAISPAMLSNALTYVTARSFNMVSIDGDTSTNDMLSILANGMAGNEEITDEGADYDAFVQALLAICVKMAKLIARDGEGATKLIIADVIGACCHDAAATIASSIISSSLLKAAMFGADANWGRVLCAAGYSGAQFDPTKVDVTFVSAAGSVDVCKNGGGIEFDEDIAKKVLSEEEITIKFMLSEGDGCAQAFGCDLTYDYVKINGDYRT